MQETDVKKDFIQEYYEALPFSNKGRFILWIQTQTNRSYCTVYLKIRKGRWSPLERDAVGRYIKEHPINPES